MVFKRSFSVIMKRRFYSWNIYWREVSCLQSTPSTRCGGPWPLHNRCGLCQRLEAFLVEHRPRNLASWRAGIGNGADGIANAKRLGDWIPWLRCLAVLPFLICPSQFGESVWRRSLVCSGFQTIRFPCIEAEKKCLKAPKHHPAIIRGHR